MEKEEEEGKTRLILNKRKSCIYHEKFLDKNQKGGRWSISDRHCLTPKTKENRVRTAGEGGGGNTCATC